MVIKVYLSFTSGNIEIKKHQEQILQILSARKVEYEEIDISDTAQKEQRDFMRANSKAQEGQKNSLPPQIFNDDDYLGDYEAFLNANEENTFYEFLKLPPPEETAPNGYINGADDKVVEEEKVEEEKQSEEEAAEEEKGETQEEKEENQEEDKEEDKGDDDEEEEKEEKEEPRDSD